MSKAKKKAKKKAKPKKHLVCETPPLERLFIGFEKFGPEYAYVSTYLLCQLMTEVRDLAVHIEQMQLIQANAKAAGYKRLSIHVTNDYDGDFNITIKGWRNETKAEERARLDQAKKNREAAARRKEARAKAQETRDREAYERLRAKYG